MIKTTISVSGMVCGMCEAHVSDALRAAFPGSKVSASRKRGEAVLLSPAAPDIEELREVIRKTGYDPGQVKQEPFEKHGLFRR